MSPIRLRLLLLIFLLSSRLINAQTVLHPGDIVLLSMATNLAMCGLPPQSDQFSFACFQDITTGTVIDITDNGWETQFANFWGDGEGTLSMSRTGGVIPAGTVITVEGRLVAGNWTYRTLSPDNGWAIADVNIPGGGFNLDDGGDQIYFMQGGTWDNQGGGGNRALYDGTIIFAANNHASWAANGTVHESNLYPTLIPCYYSQPSTGLTYMDFMEYAGPTDPANHFDWLELMGSPQYWSTYQTCTDLNMWNPQWTFNASIPIIEDMALKCPFACLACPPTDYSMYLYLPDGDYNVVITNGVDTFTVTDAQNFEPVVVNVTDTISYWIVSVEEVGGCTVYSNFYAQANINAPHNNAGVHTDFYICQSFGAYILFNHLEGNPEPGGTWTPALANTIFGATYYSTWGPATYTYFFSHGHDCPPDSASVTVHFIDADATTIDIGCSQNGTPNNIFDDQTVITLNVDGDHFGAGYTISVNSGTISPGTGVTGVSTDFTLGSGSAVGPDVVITITSTTSPYCSFQFPITSPGYCSDPCDPEMTASVFGPEDLCIKNCPLNPASIFVEVSGGYEPYSMDFQLTSPGQPTWTFTGNGIEAFQEILVCIDSVAAPTYNANTGLLTLPSFLGGSDITLTLLSVTDKYGCVGILDEPELFINIHKLPVIHTTTINLCRDEALHVNLHDYDLLISTSDDVTWYDGNPFGAGEAIANPTSANLVNIVQLWAHIKDDYCENAIKVPFNILPQPHLDSIPPISICQGTSIVLQDIPLVDAGMSMATYTFHAGLPPDTTNLLDPLVYIPADSTTIYVLATAGMCFDTLPIQIFVQDYPDFTLEAQPCDLIAGTYSILFTSSADSIHASAGVVTNNPVGQDAVTGIPNNTNVTIEILNPTGLCKDTFLIVAPNCNCPQINSPVAASPDYQVCESEPLPVIAVTVDPGMVANWYSVPSGGVAFLQNSLTYQPLVPANANYYVESFDPSTSCYSIRTPITLEVFPLAVLQNVPDPVLCDQETINLTSLTPSVLNAIPGSGGWFDLTTHLPASGIQLPQNSDGWYYVFTTTAGNCQSADTIVAVVNPLPVVDVYNIVCDDISLTYALSFTTDADVVVNNIGTLVPIAGTDSFSIQAIPYDTDVQIYLQYLATGCDSTIIQQAPNCSCPALLQTNSFHACSDQGDIDLTTFEGPGVTGTWQIVSSPPGANPATISGSTFKVVNTTNAGLYNLRFIRSIILADCIDTATFQLQLDRSPFANAGADGTACAPDNIILAGTAGGTNAQFSWQSNGTGTIANPTALNTTYTPSLADINAGSVRFTLTSTDQTGFCPPASDIVNVTIDGRAYYILNPATQTYCDTADIIVDLDALITFGTTSGQWFFPDTVNATITGGSLINPSTIPAGSYNVFYTSTNAVAPCKNDTTGVSLIIRNCACPDVSVNNPAQGLCSKSDGLNLNTLLITSEPGSWSIIATPPGSQPATITGNQFTTNNSDDGAYTVRFTLSNPVVGCPSTSDIIIDVIETPVLTVVSAKCADDLQSWEAVITSSSSTIVNNQGTLVTLGGNQYGIENIPINTHLQVSTSNGGGLCTAMLDIPNPDCACTLSISNLPDVVTLCPNETTILQAQVNDPKGAVTSFWIVASDSLYQNTLEVGQAGTYTFVALDALGCTEQHQVTVSVYTEMIPSVSWLDITCPGDQNGEIIIQAIAGGSAPYFISVNGGNMQQINAFPYIINGLGAGNYTLELFDGFSCSISFNVPIQSASSETLSLGPDESILAGDSIYLNPTLSFVPDTFYWSGDVDQLLDAKQLQQWIKPDNDQSLQLFAIDAKGCLYMDDIKIKVLLNSSIYVPTVFSPNGDGINDVLAPATDPSITMIRYFEIYDRWGELIYSVKDFVPNQAGIGWDGTMRNKKLEPGVFVYRLGATNKRGREYIKYGDVTLIR